MGAVRAWACRLGTEALALDDVALLPSLLLERFPKSVVEVHVLVLEEDGGELAVAATAASAALVDAGVDLADVVVAAQVGLVAGAGAQGAASLR